MNLISSSSRATVEICSSINQIIHSERTLIWKTDAKKKTLHLNSKKFELVEGNCVSPLLSGDEFVHPDDRSRLASVLKRGGALREQYEIDCRIAHTGESERWIRIFGIPRVSDHDEFLGYEGAIIDVTEHYALIDRMRRREARYRVLAENSVEAREKSQKSEERFVHLTTHSSDWYWETDELGRFSFLPNGKQRPSGLPPAQLLGKTRHDLAADPDSPALLEYQQKVERREAFDNLRYTTHGSTPGSLRWVNVSGAPFFENGVFRGYRGTGRDVTEEVERTNELARLARENTAIIENSPDIMAVLDPNGHYLRISEAAAEILGYCPQEFLGRHYSHFVHPDEIDTAQNAFSGHDAQVQTTSEFEARWLHRDGRAVHLSSFLRRSADESIVYMTSRDITTRKQAEMRMEHLATHDSLTGLPNRAYLHAHVERMLGERRGDTHFAVMFIDLDRFKEVNDSFGHEAGDILLREVSRRLQTHMRPDDLIVRLGGDEFVVVAPCLAGRESAAVIAQKLLSVLEDPIDIDRHEVHVTASIGISVHPEDGGSKELLFQNADTAMYRAKAAKRNGFRFFEPDMSVAVKTRMTLEGALRHALRRNEFRLHFQPRIDLRTLQVTGMEALLRWTHPEFGLVSPMEFIPIAEESGLIEAIGMWALEQACIQSAALMRRLGRPLRISVNLSARQLQSPNIVERVRALLDESGLDARLLELELTESTLIEDVDRSASLLRAFKGLGLKIAVDDFGTGYSNLAYLRRFPLDVLKFDRSFVVQQDEGIGNAEFIRAFVDMAHALKMSVVAEGVESPEVLALLRGTACDEGQGYLFAQPMPFDDIAEWLASPDKRQASR